MWTWLASSDDDLVFLIVLLFLGGIFIVIPICLCAIIRADKLAKRPSLPALGTGACPRCGGPRVMDYCGRCGNRAR